MEQKQTNFLVTLLSILLIISCLIAGFFAYQTQKLVKELQGIRSEQIAKQTPIPTAAPDPTADWKTYMGSNFSFKYPANWTLSKDVGIINDSEMKYILNVQNEITTLPISEWINKKVCTKFVTENNQNGCTIQINGPFPNSKQFTFLAHYSDMHTVVKNLNTIFDISLASREPSLNFVEIQKEYDQILSTFIFTNSQNSVITSQKAMEIVTTLPEVKEFFNKNLNAKVTLDESQSSDKVWMIHIYESFTDHNATFNWYKVDKITGNTVKQIATSPRP